VKKDDSFSGKYSGSKYSKPSRKGLVIISVAIVISVGIAAAYMGLVKAQSNMKTDPIIIHIHPHLNITDNGKRLTVPAQIGIDPSLWKDHSLDKNGMQAMSDGMSGMAPLHTHDNSGIIHVESSVKRNYTLGEFLNIWGGLDLNGKTVKMTVDGKPVSDFRNHILKDREQINLEIENK
jgi:hypothetical protein